MSISRTGVFCAVSAIAVLAFANFVHAIGAPVTISNTPTPTPINVSQTPKDCAAAIARAQWKTNDGLVSSYFDGAQLPYKAILATCYGAVLLNGRAPSANPDDYTCVGRNGRAYIVGGIQPNITVETTPDASLSPKQCRIATCNGAKGTVKVCGSPKTYDENLGYQSSGALTTADDAALPADVSSQVTPPTPTAPGGVNGSSLLDQAFFNPTPIAQQGPTAPSAQTFNQQLLDIAKVPGPGEGGSGAMLVSLPEDLSGSAVQLQGGTPGEGESPANSVQTTLMDGSTVGSDTFGEPPANEDDIKDEEKARS